MAFGDILAGFAEAGHKHRQTLLQMDYDKRSKLAEQYGKLAQDPNYPSEAREEFLNRAVQIHTLPTEKKLPKEWENLQITVQPPRATPVPQPQSPSIGAGGMPIEGAGEFDLQPPLPPPRVQSAYAPMRPEETIRLAAQAEEETEGAKRRAALKYPEPPKPYSLSPGQVQFSGQNQPVASVAPTQRTTVLSPNQRLVNEDTGTTLATAPAAPDTNLNIPDLALKAAQGDKQAQDALDRIAAMNKASGGGSTLYERLGPEAYYEKIRQESLARAQASEEAYESYVKGIESGNITNISGVPTALRAEVLKRVGERGGFIITPTDRDAIRKLNMVDQLVNDLEKYSKMVSNDPTDYEAALMLRGLRQSTAGIFSKGVFAESGVLTADDVARAQGLIPGVIESVFVPGVSEQKFKELRGIVGKARTNISRPVGTTARENTNAAVPAAPTTPAATPDAGAPPAGVRPGERWARDPSGRVLVLRNNQWQPL